MSNFFYKTFRRIGASAFAAGIVLFSAVFYYDGKLSDNYYISEGKDLSFSTMHSIEGESKAGYSRTSMANTPAGSASTVELKLFGIIPIKSAHVSVVDRPVVTPGGTPFGIKLFTEGVMVIDIGNVDTAEGTACPAKVAGIQKGDILLTVADEPISSNEQIAGIIEQSGGEAIPVNLRRNDKTIKTMLVPLKSSADGKYKSGIWVRDSSAGIGTVTYYDPNTGNFAGLGHGICDVDTGEIMPLQSGEVCNVVINSVVKGRAGTPGELRGAFASNVPCGFLHLNNESGIFGTLLEEPNSLDSIPIKLKQEVTAGPATILCTLDDGEIQEYEINIDKVDLNPKQVTKNMLITVTDEKLLEKTGGIVQGMSGSPILQDGKLVGAVTHVFVNNPAKGYGIFAENMLNYQ